jgi:hypothetical protein
LLAKELRAKGSGTEDVGDVVRIPSLREHGDGDDAANAATQTPSFADGVHDFAEEFLIGEILAGARVAGALDEFAAETLDFIRGEGAEVVVESIAGF